MLVFAIDDDEIFKTNQLVILVPFVNAYKTFF